MLLPVMRGALRANCCCVYSWAPGTGLVRNGLNVIPFPPMDVAPPAPGPFPLPHQFSVASTVPPPRLFTPSLPPNKLLKWKHFDSPRASVYVRIAVTVVQKAAERRYGERRKWAHRRMGDAAIGNVKRISREAPIRPLALIRICVFWGF